MATQAAGESEPSEDDRSYEEQAAEDRATWGEEQVASAHSAEAEALAEEQRALSPDDHETLERTMSFAEMSDAARTASPMVQEESEQTPDPGSGPDPSVDARGVLENGVREIAGEVRNSLDFHRSREGGGEVSHVVLSGSALDIGGFAEALQGYLGLEVRAETVEFANEDSQEAKHRLSVAAGLAAEEVEQ